ncbi:MAG: acylglycerol kinase family protein, partial [Desulfobacterales bacterium]
MEQWRLSALADDWGFHRDGQKTGMTVATRKRMNRSNTKNDSSSAFGRYPAAPALAVRIGMLHNPLSGGNRKGLQRIRAVVTAAPCEILQREAQTPTDVSETLSDFARREINTIVINGGDGTVQAALTAIFHHKLFETMPLIAVLPSAGTTSMIAGDIGLKGSRPKALQRLFKWSHTQDIPAAVAKRAVLRVQVPNEENPMYGMFLGAAGIYQATRYRFEHSHANKMRGEFVAGAILVRFLIALIFKHNRLVFPVPVTTRLNRNPAEQRRYYAMLITTLERLFLGLRPFWDSEPKPLHYFALGSRPRHLLRVAWSFFRKQMTPLIDPINGYFSHNVDEVQLVLDSGFNLDGQLYHPNCQQ